MKTAQMILDEAVSIALPAEVKSPGTATDFTNKLLVLLNLAVAELADEISDLHALVASIEQRVVK